MKTYCYALFVGLIVAGVQAQNTTNFPTIGHIDRFDSALDALIDEDAKIEVLCGGFEWAEGPVWVPEKENKVGGYVLFSDIPHNAVMKWQEGLGVSIFMKPAGYTGVADYGREPGSNGLALDPQGRLVLCEHGDRRISVLTEGGGKMTLANRWNGKRFNSPNDLAIRKNGEIFFTDPIYGLPERQNDPMRELDFCGVYRLRTDGTVLLQSRDVSRPNGIAFSPDEKVLYVANSDGRDPIWRAFPVQADGNLGEPRAFFDSSKQEHIGRGGGDGLKVGVSGHVFATGPGGVLVISPEGRLLGRIVTGERIANVGFGNDGSVLYLTSDMYLCRIQTNTKGVGFWWLSGVIRTGGKIGAGDFGNISLVICYLSYAGSPRAWITESDSLEEVNRWIFGRMTNDKCLITNAECIFFKNAPDSNHMAPVPVGSQV